MVARLGETDALLNVLEALPISARDLEALWEQLGRATRFPRMFPTRGTAQEHYIPGGWGLYYKYDAKANEIVPVGVVNNHRGNPQLHRISW